jgi:hypothetical protein
VSISTRLYRYARPSVAATYRRLFGSHVLTRAQLFDDPPEGYSVYRFGNTESYDFDRPRHVGELPTVIERQIGERIVPRSFVVEATDPTVIGSSALVDASGYLLLESTLGEYQRLIDASVRALLSGQLPFDTRFQHADIAGRDEPLFLLTGSWSTEYYHWITDYLIQVFAIEVYRERIGLDPLVLIPSDPPTWLRDSLSFAGINDDRILEWSGGRTSFSSVAVGGSHYHTMSARESHAPSPTMMARLGDRIRAAVPEAQANFADRSKRLYVSRADATDRRIRNEGALIEVLDDYGFERIVPGEKSFAEQVRLFSEAEIVLGPHGAGLTNIVFATETVLIELFGSYRNACFFVLAKGMNHDYACVTCRPDGEDLIINPNDIDTIIDTVISSEV